MSRARSRFGDWSVLVLSLVLAWGVWYAVREDLDEVREVELPIAVLVTPGGNVDGSLREGMVPVRVKGSRRDLDRLTSMTKPLLVPVRGDDLAVDQYTGTRAVHAEDLVLPEGYRSGNLRVLEILRDPPTVTVYLWKVKTDKRSVAPPEFPGLKELSVEKDRPRWPREVLVRAPEADLNQIPVLRTTVDPEQLRRAVEAMGDSARTTVTLPLTILDAPTDGFTLLDPRTLEVTVDLVRNVGATVTLPLQVLRSGGRDARRLRIGDPGKPWFLDGDPPAVKLELRGTPRALAEVTPERVRAFVLADELPADATEGDLRVHTSDLPAGVLLAESGLTVPVRAE